MAEPAFIPEVEEDESESESPQQTASNPAEEPLSQKERQSTATNGQYWLIYTYIQVFLDFEERYINEKWYGRYKTTQQFVQYVDNEWKGVEEEEYEFVQQLWMEQEASEIQVYSFLVV